MQATLRASALILSWALLNPASAQSITDDAQWVTIPGGKSWRGDDRGSQHERPRHQVQLNSFRMQRHEFTHAELLTVLNAVLAAGAELERPYFSLSGTVGNQAVRLSAAHPKHPNETWQQQDLCYLGNHSKPHRKDVRSSQLVWTGKQFDLRDEAGHPDGSINSRAKHPAIEVTWYGAMFIAWWLNEQDPRADQCIDLRTFTVDRSRAGYRLPTEAEWEHAARGGNPDAIYPWLQHKDQTPFNGWGSGDRYEGGPVYPYTTPVGSYSANGYGLYDMAGNVWEWTLDQYHNDSYPVAIKEHGKVVTNPCEERPSTKRITRGGGYGHLWQHMRCSYRRASHPHGWNHVGFRLVFAGQTVPPMGIAKAAP